MKFVLLFLSLFLVSCKNKAEDIPKIPKGTINQNWVYNNEMLKFKMQLPRNWNFVDNSQGASAFIPMKENMTHSIFKNEDITINENFNFADEASIVQLFVISKNTQDEIRNGNRKGDLGFVVVSSENGNAEDDVEDAQKEILSQLKDNPEALKLNEKNLKTSGNLSFGKNDKIPYFHFTVGDYNGNATGNRIYAFKNYGTYNLLILITYFSENELIEIKSLLETIEN
ncbi:hypothetical protein [Chryseobacterium caseinilyticum]|uniref:PsbP C-terminal domain-containing protein n=1 Tax=Chryseobacterium caseinilyticum TaxID=2771428 RepID=A0ABR8Z6D5_9FLAO|nr:hypothetical protein [Chryseobacterium caseinilyticum]MBD8080842.1 hypothetical protein [Chryseobacterium caseinilyticum]